MLKTGLIVAAAAAGVLLPATAASAWTANYEDGIQDQIQLIAAAGETNDLSLSLVGNVLRAVDAGAVSKAILPCKKLGVGGADCPYDAPDKTVWIELGDKDDTADLADGLGSGVRIGIDGGAGKDRISNGEAAGLLSGNAGSDVIRPGRGADDVHGGDGFDVVGYAERTAPVRADLGGGKVSGEAGELDSLVGVEGVLTGTGDDEIIGTDAEETLMPIGGRDHVVAGGGDDAVDVRDGYPDTVDCGAGADTVGADQLDVLVGCETAEVDFVPPAEPAVPPATPSAPDAPPAPTNPAPAPTPAPTTVPPVPVVDRTRPTLRAVKVTHRRGTATVRFALSEQANVAVTVERCARPRRCRKVKTVRRSAARGANTMRVRTGAGRLRLRIVAIDAAGNRSRTTAKRLTTKG